MMYLELKMTKRHVLIHFGPMMVDPDLAEKMHLPPDIEIYALDRSASNLDHQIEMALLSDLETPIVLVFVGGGQDVGKYFADAYGGLHFNTLSDIDPAVWNDN
jgi:hypothetical protein